PWPGQFTRYLMPLSPFLTVCAVLPLSTIGASVRMRQHRWTMALARVALAGAVVIAFAAEGYALIKAFRNRHKKEAIVIPRSGGPGHQVFYHDGSWQAWEEAAAWIATHAPPDAVITTTAPHFFYLRTGRRAVLPPMEPDPTRARHLLERVPVSYVIVDQLQFLDLSRRYALPAVKSDPIGWRLVYSTHFRHRPGWLTPADFAHRSQIYQRIKGEQ